MLFSLCISCAILKIPLSIRLKHADLYLMLFSLRVYRLCHVSQSEPFSTVPLVTLRSRQELVHNLWVKESFGN